MTEKTGDDVKAYRIRVEGRVQGVGFRYSARHEALRRKLAGWVRNEDDGAVSVYCEGPQQAVDAFISWLRTGPPGARVTDVNLRQTKPESSHKTFSVVF
ncbi:MAG: acylphosphatase [Spirochaetales bacterium]|nr:MAG: acylphosphatase [Spirochaetales bacterium]